MTHDIIQYKNGQKYITVSTYDFKRYFSKFLREMNKGDYDGAVVTSYDRQVGVFLPTDRLSRQEAEKKQLKTNGQLDQDQ